jgi:MtN3 and saliva related transmembrane protein
MSADWSRQAIGWASSALLVATLGKQVWKQWREGKSEGISIWLFIGQTAASIGFTVYSVLVGDWVFVVTNTLMLLNGLVGYVVLVRNRRRERGTRVHATTAG